MTTVSAKRENGEPVSVEFDFGDNLEAMVGLFGEDIVYAHARGSFVVSLQSFIRSQIKQGKSPAEINDAVAKWTPGQRKKGKTPKEKLLDQLSAMSPEDRAEVLKEYKASAKK